MALGSPDHASSQPGLGTPLGQDHAFCLPFIKSKWQCLHRLVASLISKHKVVWGGAGARLSAEPLPWARKSPIPHPHPLWCTAQISALHSLAGHCPVHPTQCPCAAITQPPPHSHNPCTADQLLCCLLQSCPCESITGSFAGSSPKAQTHLQPRQSLLLHAQTLFAPTHQHKAQTRLPHTVPVNG